MLITAESLQKFFLRSGCCLVISLPCSYEFSASLQPSCIARLVWLGRPLWSSPTLQTCIGVSINSNFVTLKFDSVMVQNFIWSAGSAHLCEILKLLVWNLLHQVVTSTNNYPYKQACKQTSKQASKQTSKQASKQTNKQTNKQTRPDQTRPDQTMQVQYSLTIVWATRTILNWCNQFMKWIQYNSHKTCKKRISERQSQTMFTCYSKVYS